MKKNDLNSPLVYIILVNYKSAQDTIECLESLKNISYPNYKIVVIDNASKDNSYSDIKEYDEDSKYIVLETEKNLGFAGANNIGIKLALESQAEYVLLLNNDTLVEPNFLEGLVELAMTSEEIGAVGGKIFYNNPRELIWYAGAEVNSFTGITKHIGDKQIDSEKYNYIKETGYITGCMMLVSTKVIEQIGLMDEKYFLYYEETDWNIRIKKSGYKIMYTPKSVIYHKVSASTKKMSYVMNYYYDRNVNYFVTKNYGLLNRVFMYFYVRIILLGKYLKCIAIGNINKRRIVAKTYNSIVKKEMGIYND